RLTPAENRPQLREAQWIAHQRVLANDDEQTKTAHTPVTGHIAAICAAGVESTFTLRAFNVSLTDLSPGTFVPWLAATV
ncbi:hypothetical protein MRO55_26345, partial [Escherichia coli]|uniref:hypothetical protein n=1 Tax=Escherichia coli TaxID=562 RepID=UPI0021153DFF